jgi:hypothetical protein
VPGPFGERVREAIAQIEASRMAALAVSPPAAHRARGQVSVDRNDVDHRVTKEPVDNVLSGGPEPGLDNYPQVDADGRWH